jgi:uncharacterized protein YehS (DUF1456 family)
MDNNSVLRRLVYILGFDNKKIESIFLMGNQNVSNEEIICWMKKEADELFQNLKDSHFSAFLNGLIVFKRGKKENEVTLNEKTLNNNLIFRKLRIAFNLNDQVVIEVLLLANFRMSKSELSAFFRHPTHPNYRECKNQVLRYFLTGLAMKYKT